MYDNKTQLTNIYTKKSGLQKANIPYNLIAYYNYSLYYDKKM